jgi:hypothetical protein
METGKFERTPNAPDTDAGPPPDVLRHHVLVDTIVLPAAR